MKQRSPGSVGESVVGPIGIIISAVLMACAAGLVVYALVDFWPPAPATSSAMPSASPSASPQSKPALGQTPSQATPELPPVSFLGRTITLSLDRRLFLVVASAGALGGFVHALRSMYWYVGNRNLRRSWLLAYAMIPLVGTLLGLVFYLVLRAGLVSAQASAADLSPYGFAAIAALVGLFSQQAAEKLKQVFSTIFAPAEKGEDHTPAK